MGLQRASLMADSGGGGGMSGWYGAKYNYEDALVALKSMEELLSGGPITTTGSASLEMMSGETGNARRALEDLMARIEQGVQTLDNIVAEVTGSESR